MPTIVGRTAERRIVAAFAVGAVLLGTVACGESTGSRATTAPSSMPPSVTGIVIGGPDAVRTGFASDYTVTASMSDGSSQDVGAASCTSSDPSVASIAAPCRLTGNKHGSTNLTVSSQGRTTSKTVNVVNNYGGSWTGDYRVTTCDDAGVLLDWCVWALDEPSAFSLILTQSGSGQDQISGTISLGEISAGPLRGTVTGSVTNDGRLLLSGSTVINTYPGVAFQFSIGGWNTILSGNANLSGHAGMSGTWDQTLVAIGANGNAFQRQTILSATQLTSEPPPGSSGPSLSPGIRTTMPFGGELHRRF